VKLVLKVKLVLLDPREERDPKVKLDRQVPQVLKERLGIRALQGPLVNQGLLVTMVQMVPQAKKVQVDLMVKLDPKVLLVKLDNKVPTVIKVPKVRQVYLDL